MVVEEEKETRDSTQYLDWTPRLFVARDNRDLNKKARA